MTHTAITTLSSLKLFELIAISLIAGMGIATVGPGGVLMTIGLYSVPGLSPSTVAGTSIVTHLATGIVGSAAYLRSGQLRHPPTRRLAMETTAAHLRLNERFGSPHSSRSDYTKGLPNVAERKRPIRRERCGSVNFTQFLRG